jgi:ATP-dependent Lon protease
MRKGNRGLATILWSIFRNFLKIRRGGTAIETLPLLPLRDIVVFPHMVAPLFVGRNKSVSALSSAMNKDKRIFLATQKNAGVDNPKEKDICDVGVIGYGASAVAASRRHGQGVDRRNSGPASSDM